MLLARRPDDCLPRPDLLTLAVVAAHPARALEHCEELLEARRMPRDNAAGAELDDDDVRVRREPSHHCVHAPGCSHRPLAAELDAPHTRSITAAIAWPKPMHIVATPYRPSRRSSS